MSAENAAGPPKTLTDLARKRFKGVLDRIASFLLRIGLTPDALTIAGLVGHLIGAFLISQGWFFFGGIVIIFLAPLDAIDGTMSRLQGKESRFGAFLDSVTDRYSEIVMYAGLVAYYVQQAEGWLIGMTFAALAGSIMVSYTRARAEGLGVELRIGFLTRLERYLVMVPCLMLGIPWLGVNLIAVLANLTALQRIIHMRKRTRGE